MNAQKVKTSRKGQPVDSLDLKAERVQQEMLAIARLKAERVQELLRIGWRLTRGDTTLERVRNFPDLAVAASYAKYVADTAHAERLRPVIVVRGNRVTLAVRVFPPRGQSREQIETLLNFAAYVG